MQAYRVSRSLQQHTIASSNQGIKCIKDIRSNSNCVQHSDWLSGQSWNEMYKIYTPSNSNCVVHSDWLCRPSRRPATLPVWATDWTTVSWKWSMTYITSRFPSAGCDWLETRRLHPIRRSRPGFLTSATDVSTLTAFSRS